jgi:hypothetical protein
MVAGVWRNLVSVRAYIGGQWRDLANFAPPLTLSASPATVTGAIFGAGTAITTPTAATPSGGVAPFTYAWARLTGPASAVAGSPTSGTTTFSMPLLAGQADEAAFRCTATDALGNTATADVAAVFRSDTDLLP